MGSWTKKLYRIGLTGGIASGKTTVAQWLRDEGLLVVNLDEVGRDVTDSRPDLIEKINKLCGTTGTELDRKRVREVVFANTEIRAALEGLLHPPILQEFEQREKAAIAEGRGVIVCEAALLVESGYHEEMDELVVIWASAPTRRARLVKRDGITNELADKILASQSPDQARRLATYVIENEGTLDELRDKLDAHFERWSSRDKR
jgi:dephospho-CoA kinase